MEKTNMTGRVNEPCGEKQSAGRLVDTHHTDDHTYDSVDIEGLSLEDSVEQQGHEKSLEYDEDQDSTLTYEDYEQHYIHAQIGLRKTLGKYQYDEHLNLPSVDQSFYSTVFQGVNIYNEESALQSDLLGAIRHMYDEIETKLCDYIHGKLSWIGSQTDGTKVQTTHINDLGDLDALYIINDKRYKVSFDGKSHTVLDVNDMKISPIDIRKNFANKVEELLKEMALPEGLVHSGYNSPGFSGVRYNGPAVTLCFTWQDNMVTVDITPVFNASKTVKDELYQQNDAVIQQIRAKNPRQYFESTGFHIVPDAVKNQWQLSSAAMETYVISTLSCDVPIKNALLFAKLICHNLTKFIMYEGKNMNNENALIKLGELIGSTTTERINSLMRYGHIFLNTEEAEKYNESSKTAISINSAAVKYFLFHAAVQTPDAFANKCDRTIVQQLLHDTFDMIGSGRMSVPHYFLGQVTRTDVNLFSVSSICASQISTIHNILNRYKVHCQMLKGKFHPDGTSVEELQQYVVQPADLPCPDYCIEIPHECDPTFDILEKSLIALLNGTGGVILLKSQRISPTAYMFEKTLKRFLGIRFSDYFPDNYQIIHEPGYIIVPMSASKCVSVDSNSRYPLLMVLPDGSFDKVPHPISPFFAPQKNHQDNQVKDDKHLSNLSATTDTMEVLSPNIVSDDNRTPKDMNIDELNMALKLKTCLRWTEQNPNWESNLSESTNGKDIHVEFWKTDMFNATNPLHFTPAEDIILKSNIPGIEDALKHIKNHCINREGVVFVISNSMSSFIQEAGSCRPASHLVDFLVVYKTGHVHLWMLMEASENQRTQLAYLMQSGRFIKRNILQIAQTPKQKVAAFPRLIISGHLVLTTNKVISRSLYPMIPEQSENTTNQYYNNIICQSLATMMLHSETQLRDRIDNIISISLSAQDVCHIWEHEKYKFHMITGPPGSGKTIIALHICKMYISKGRKVGYISVNPNLNKYIITQTDSRLVDTAVVQTEDDIHKLFYNKFLNDKDLVIFDDAHNIVSSEDSWEKLFKYIRSRKSEFMALMDNKIQNFREGNITMLKCFDQFCQQHELAYHHLPLKEVHRNKKKIVSFFKDCAQHPEPIPCTSKYNGDDIELQHLKNISVHSEENMLVKLIQDLIDPQKQLDGASGAYSTRDIAILLDSQNAERDVLKYQQILSEVDQNVQDAGEFPVKGIVVDTLDHFVGLDAELVIFIVSDEKLQLPDTVGTSVKSRTYYLTNPHYKAFIASRARSKMIFVIEKEFKMDVVETLQFNDMARFLSNSKAEYNEKKYYSSEFLHSLRYSNLAVQKSEDLSQFPEILSDNMESAVSDCMTGEEKEKLRHLRIKLVQNLLINENLKWALPGLLTEATWHRIFMLSRAARTGYLLDLLPTKGPEAFQRFVSALHQTEQNTMAHALSQTISDIRINFGDQISEILKLGLLPAEPVLPQPRLGHAATPLQIRFEFGNMGTDTGQLMYPNGFCLGMDGDICVADTKNHRVQIFKNTGEFKYQFGCPGDEDGQLQFPRKVAFIVDSRKYVVCDLENKRCRMQIFTETGQFIRKISTRYIDYLTGLAVTKAGNIVAVDCIAPAVFVIAETGAIIRWFGCSDYIRQPSDIAIYDSHYYICDFKGHCVVVFDEYGNFIQRIGENITPYPSSIDISSEGYVLVGDSHGDLFHLFVLHQDGTVIGEFCNPSFPVRRCRGLKITPEGHIVTIANLLHHLIVYDTLFV